MLNRTSKITRCYFNLSILVANIFKCILSTNGLLLDRIHSFFTLTRSLNPIHVFGNSTEQINSVIGTVLIRINLDFNMWHMWYRHLMISSLNQIILESVLM